MCGIFGGIFSNKPVINSILLGLSKVGIQGIRFLGIFKFWIKKKNSYARGKRKN